MALNNLSKNDYITICSAGKGGAVVILDSDLYQSLNMAMLQDTTMYRALPYDPMPIFDFFFYSLLQQGVEMGVINQQEADKHNIAHPVTPIFHSFPKLH